jgi:hypothetical protein
VGAWDLPGRPVLLHERGALRLGFYFATGSFSVLGEVGIPDETLVYLSGSGTWGQRQYFPLMGECWAGLVSTRVLGQRQANQHLSAG